MSDTQTYYAKSAWSDPQNIKYAAEMLLAALAAPEIVAIIPLAWMPKILALSAFVGIFIRTKWGLRPVANIAPGQVKPVEVEKLKPTEKGSETRKVD